ncbi:MAG: glutaredoxin domain-containing protein [Burkholderiales bacterium]
MLTRIIPKSLGAHRLACLVVAICLASPAYAQLYRWVDSEGRATFSTTPPPGTAAPQDQEKRVPLRPAQAPAQAPAPSTVVQTERPRTPQLAASDPAEAAQASPESARRKVTAPPRQVTLYGTSWCPYCARARAYFQTYRVAFKELDIEKSAAANAEFKKLGGNGIPLIVIDGMTIQGFDEQKLEMMLGLR